MQDDTHKQKQHDDRAEVEGTTVEKQMDDQIRQAQQGDNPRKDTAVFHLLGRCRRLGLQLRFFLIQQRGFNGHHLVAFGMHQRIDNHDGYDDDSYHDKVLRSEDSLSN